MPPTALITGVTGQDGAYLSRLLAEKDYRIFGLVPRSGRYPFGNLDYLGVTDRVEFIEGDLTDEASLFRAVGVVRPDEVYNLAALSSVGGSWDRPRLATEVNALGPLTLLEAVRQLAPNARFFQASSSTMFGDGGDEAAQSEQTPPHPRSPYAVAKLHAHGLVSLYRETHGLFCVSGILFNHESPIRGPEFVTRKIAINVARIKLGLVDRFELANLDGRRDWGFAGDYVRGVNRMLQQDTPNDYVLATGKTHSVADFVDAAFRHVGIADWRDRVQVAPADSRPIDRVVAPGDPRHAQSELGWRPSVGFDGLVAMMVDADIERLEHEPAVAVVRR